MLPLGRRRPLLLLLLLVNQPISQCIRIEQKEHGSLEDAHNERPPTRRVRKEITSKDTKAKLNKQETKSSSKGKALIRGVDKNQSPKGARREQKGKQPERKKKGSGYRGRASDELLASSSLCPHSLGADIFTGSWVETVNDMLVDTDGNNDYSMGDVVLIEGNQVHNQQKPRIVGQTIGKCTALANLEYSFCLLTYTLPSGPVAVSGEFGYMHAVSGKHQCHGDVSDLTVAGYAEGDNIMYDFAFDEAVNFEQCRGKGSFSGTWLLLHVPVTTFDPGTALPGDQLFLDSLVTVTVNGATGVALGECTILETNGIENPFCNIVFGFSEGQITVSGRLDKLLITSASGCFVRATGTIAGSYNANGEMMFDVTLDAGRNTDMAQANCLNWRLDATLVETGQDGSFDATNDGAIGSGDSYLFDGHLVASDGFPDGTASGVCTILSKFTSYCTIVLEFAEGSIAVQGPFSSMAITAGTGCYNGLAGFFYGFQVAKGVFEYAAETI